MQIQYLLLIEKYYQFKEIKVIFAVFGISKSSSHFDVNIT